MRDLIVAFYLLGAVPLILVRPQVGVLMWCLISYMNPHQFGWGFMSTFPIALVTAVATLLGALASPDKGKMRVDPVIAMMAAFTLWICLTTATALEIDLSFPKWSRVIKVLLMAFATYWLMQTRERIHALVWVIVVSIGVYGVRGGLFTLATGAAGRVFGPPNTMIEDNNQLALALIMIVPLMRYLQIQSADRLVRLGLGFAMFLTGISIVGSFSRGAMLASCAMAGWLLIRSRHKLLTLVAVVLIGAAALGVAPQSWFERMNTIKTYEEDGSATGRIDAWTFAFRMALQRPVVGGGFLINDDGELFMRLVPEAFKPRAFHSIYFEVMGEHGFVGLGLFLGLLALAMARTAGLRKAQRGPDTAWASDLTAMIQTSLVGYIVGGAFLNMAFFDLYYHLLVLISLVAVVVSEPRRGWKASADPAAGTGPKAARPPVVMAAEPAPPKCQAGDKGEW
jgi:putative inorganic carbon (hco3(-)) transporter